MNNSEKLNGTSWPEKEDFCNYLNKEDITDAGNKHTKRVCKDFETKLVGEYYNFYVQNDTLLLTDVFSNFSNMCLKIYGIDPAHFLSAPGFTWKAALKKQQSKIRFNNWYRYVVNDGERL